MDVSPKQFPPEFKNHHIGHLWNQNFSNVLYIIAIILYLLIGIFNSVLSVGNQLQFDVLESL